MYLNHLLKIKKNYQIIINFIKVNMKIINFIKIKNSIIIINFKY